MEDEEILTLLQSRKEQGINELEQKYGRRLRQLAERILPEEDAKECLNDTYLAVWNSIPPKRPQFLFAYTAKICRNLALNKVEWNQAAKRNAVVVELSAELEQCIPDSAAAVGQQELGELLTGFLRGLAEEKRQLFVRRYWYGESIRELSDRFGYRESKVKSMLFRMRKQLWNELKKEGIVG
ncbi:MAG: RNA polymerase sigma factor [Lachnospiraceae bacterium]